MSHWSLLTYSYHRHNPDPEYHGPLLEVPLMRRWLPLIRAVFGRAVSAGGVLAVSVVLSRQLSLPEAGSFFTAFAAAMGVSIFLQAGQPLLLIRKVAVRDDGPDLFFQTLGNIALISGPLICLMIAWQILTRAGGDPVGWIWVPLLPIVIIGQCASYLKGQGRPGAGGLFEVGVISAVATIYFVIFPAQTAMSAWWIFCVIAWISAIIAIAGVMHGMRRGMPNTLYNPKLIYEARILWLNSVLSYVSQWGGVLIVAATLDADAVAILNAVFRLLAPIQFVVITLDYFLAPKLAARGTFDLRRLRMLGVLASLGLIAPYLLVLLVIPDIVLVTLFGDAFSGYGFALQILAFGALVQIVLGANGIALNMWGQDRIALNGVLLRSAMATFGSAALIPYYGLTAAVIAFSAAVVCQNGYYRYVVNRLQERPPADEVEKR